MGGSQEEEEGKLAKGEWQDQRQREEEGGMGGRRMPRA